MQCRSVLTRIDALRTGELAPMEQTAVESHLRTCRSCGESCDDVGGLADAVKSLAVAPPQSCCEAITDHFDRVDTPAGPVTVVYSDRGIRLIAAADADFRAAYAKRCGRILAEGRMPDALRREVLAAVAGEGVDKPHVDLDEASDLEHDVLQTLTRIPRGEVRTYAWVARQIGRPRAVRAVGNVVAKNRVPFLMPCHRVVPSSGGIGNYIFGNDAKRALLEREGVDVAELEKLAAENVRFIGSRTTHIFCFPTCKDARRIREENRVPFHGADDALESGYRPCRRCQPVAA